MLDRLAAALGVNPRKFWRGVLERLIRSLPPRLIALYYVWRALQGDWSKALDTVESVAHDPTTRNLDYWTPTYRLTVSNPRWGENMYRALAARVRTGSRDPETALLLELAWLALKRKHGR